MTVSKRVSEEQEILDTAVEEFKQNLSHFLSQKENETLNPVSMNDYMSFVQKETNRIGKKLVTSHIESYDSSEDLVRKDDEVYKPKK